MKADCPPGLEVGLVLEERVADGLADELAGGLPKGFQFALELVCRLPLVGTQYGLLLPRLLLAFTGARGVLAEPRPFNATRRSWARPAL